MIQPKVSVLVPVYGVEKYIERCARSLFNQSMTDGIEFIFVDDASTDSSIKILQAVIDEFPNRRQQVRIVRHEQNRGLAVARVTGLKHARGEYVAHCDSDDWVEPRMYELMYKEANHSGADIVVCDFFRDKEYSSSRATQKLLDNRSDITSSMLRFEDLNPFLWIRLIRRDFYLKHEFYADPRISFCEDLAVTIPMHLSTDNVRLLNQPFYHYNVANSGSMTREKSLKKIRVVRSCNERIREIYS